MEIEEALDLISSGVKPVEDSIELPLCEAFGHVLSGDIMAYADVPAFARSAMDGYAVKAEETKGADRDAPVILDVTGEILAGDCKEINYTRGSAVRVMTGGMIPEGYDAVVRQEDTDYGEDEVRVYSAVQKGRNYSPAGEEIKKGDTVIPDGRRIGRVEVGLLASLGMKIIKVRRPMRAAIISTGSELCDAGEELPPGKIYNSIRYMLSASIRQEKLEVVSEENCPDEAEILCERISKACEKADIVITTGGVSVGKRDLMPGVLDRIGAVKLFSGVNIQPGTPTIASMMNDRLILSLSGNPYAAMVNFDLYFWTAAAAHTGSSYFRPETKEAVLADRYDKVNRMRRFVRARMEDGRVYLPVLEHMSSVFGNMDSCNCYMDIPGGRSVSPGDKVKIWKIRSL